MGEEDGGLSVFAVLPMLLTLVSRGKKRKINLKKNRKLLVQGCVQCLQQRGRGGGGGPLKRRCLGLEKRGSNYENESPCTARIFISAVAMGTGLVRLLPLPRRAALQHNTMRRRDFHRRRKEGRG